MRMVVSILLLSIMMSYSFNRIGTFVEYVTDIEAYTDKYCENKHKPNLHCNGKCHLTKELAKQEQQEQEKHPQIVPLEIVLLNTFEEVKVDLTPIIQQSNKFDDYQFSLKEGRRVLIFHPPKTVLNV